VLEETVVNRPFRFAVQGGPLADAEALSDHARHVEALGYEELYSYDHIGWAAGAGRGDQVDPFAPLVVAARATQRLRVGPLVLNNEFHQPVLLARTAATVDRLTGGRLVLGLGTGYAADEHDSIGSPIRPPGPRVTRFGESLEIVRSLLDTGAATVDGVHEHVDIGDLGIRPLQTTVPFLIGGHGRRVVGLAARFGDIFQFTGLTHGERGAPSVEGFALGEVIERNRWLQEAAGERIDAIERSALVQFTHVAADAPTAGDLADRFGLPESVVIDTPFALFGSLEQVVDKIERQRDTLGISHYVVRDADGFAPVVDALAGR
jgi:probable F420-dependent oxidoreductase